MLPAMLQAPPPPTAKPVRLWWAFTGVATLVTVALLSSVVSSFWGARALAETVTRGQAAMLFHIAHRVALSDGERPTDAALAPVIEEGAELGLHWIAIVRPRGRIVAQAGEAQGSLAPAELRGQPLQPIAAGGLVRVTAPVGPPQHPRHPRPTDDAFGLGPRGFPPPPIDDGMGPPPHPPGAPPGGPPPGLRIAVEFEPMLARDLEHRAKRDLAVGIAAIVALWVAAALLWRVAGRATRAEMRLGDQRHLAALGEMSAVVAHELRNPLASLKGNAQLLEEQVQGHPSAPKATRVVAEAVRLQALSDGLLAFVRSGRVQPEPVDVAQLAREIVAMSPAEVDLTAEGLDAPWPLDPGRISQVLHNLIDNAYQADPEGVVKVVVEMSESALTFEISDRGPGVPPEARAKIFTPFHTSRTRGTGLGLAVAYQVVDLHGGSITCEDRPGGGALFRVTLPLRR